MKQHSGIENYLEQWEKMTGEARDSAISMKLENGSVVSTDDLIPQLLNPHAIFDNPNAQDNFINYISTLRSKYIKPLALVSGTTLSDDAELAPEQLAISICQLLKTGDVCLDLPLVRKNYQSMRDILVEFLIEYFDEDTILAHFEPIEEISETYDTNFNTAGADGFLVKRFVQAAEVLCRSWGYEKCLGFAELVSRKFHGSRRKIGSSSAEQNRIFEKNPEFKRDLPSDSNEKPEEGKTHRTEKDFYKFIHGYPSATTAMEAVYGQYFWDFKESDNVIVSTQEYDSITEFFERRGKDCIRPVDLFSEDVNTIEGYCQRLTDQIDENTKAIIISTKTRFGDAPCSLGADEKGVQRSNTYYLGILIEKVRDYCAEIGIYVPVILDGTQAFGRSHDPIMAMRPDIYFSNSGKKVNTGGSAELAVDADFVEYMKEVNNRELLGPSGKVNDVGMIAATLAQQWLMSRHGDVRKPERNFGKNSRWTQEGKEGKRMKKRTSQIIELAEQYGPNFVRLIFGHIQISFMPKASRDEVVRRFFEMCPDGISTPEDLAKMFECQVVFPSKRFQQDFSGIVTLYLPNLKGRDLVKAMEKYRALPRGKKRYGELGGVPIACRNGLAAFRISVDENSEEAIMDLFKLIQVIHTEMIVKKMHTYWDDKNEKFRYVPDLDQPAGSES